MKLQAERVMNWAEFEVDEGVVEAGNASAVELIAEPIPGVRGGGMQLSPIEKDVALVGVEVEREAAIGEGFGAAQVLETGERIAEGEDGAVIARQAEALVETLLAKLGRAFVGVGGGVIDGAVGLAVAVVVDDEGAVGAVAIGVGEDVFVDRARGLIESVKQKVAAFSEQRAAMEERGDLAFVALD